MKCSITWNLKIWTFITYPLFNPEPKCLWCLAKTSELASPFYYSSTIDAFSHTNTKLQTLWTGSQVAAVCKKVSKVWVCRLLYWFKLKHFGSIRHPGDNWDMQLKYIQCWKPVSECRICQYGWNHLTGYMSFYFTVILIIYYFALVSFAETKPNHCWFHVTLESMTNITFLFFVRSSGQEWS